MAISIFHRWRRMTNVRFFRMPHSFIEIESEFCSHPKMPHSRLFYRINGVESNKYQEVINLRKDYMLSECKSGQWNIQPKRQSFLIKANHVLQYNSQSKIAGIPHMSIALFIIQFEECAKNHFIFYLFSLCFSSSSLHQHGTFCEIYRDSIQ